jgi:hypothetical protein
MPNSFWMAGKSGAKPLLDICSVIIASSVAT